MNRPNRSWSAKDKYDVIKPIINMEKSLSQVSRELNIDMPITEAIYSVLYQGANPNEAVLELMTRSKKHEMEEVVNYGLLK